MELFRTLRVVEEKRLELEMKEGLRQYKSLLRQLFNPGLTSEQELLLSMAKTGLA